MFSWYLMGQVLFFFVPYLLIEMFNVGYKYKFKMETEIIGWIFIVISNVIIYVFCVSTKKITKVVITFKSNKFFINALIYFIYFMVFFSFLFALYNVIDIGISNITNNNILRNKISVLGPFAIVLMVPLGVSTYHWILFINGNKSKYYIYKITVFTLIAFIVAFSRGQRTDLVLIALFPLLYLFLRRRSFTLLITAFIGVMGLVSIYAAKFKTNLQSLNLSIIDSLVKILTGDIDRNWTYWTALENSKILSSNIMENPFSGYLYTFLTFIPRRLAEFKGYSTETWFVFFMGNTKEPTWRVDSIGELNWGVTLSGIAEALINGGFIGLLFFSIFIGVLLNIFQVLNNKFIYLSAVLPFMVVLFSGYTIYNILVIYFPIAVVLFVFNLRDRIENRV